MAYIQNDLLRRLCSAPIRCASPEETEALAAELARELIPPIVIALHGDLGAGKTVFARGFARGLGVTETVTSPTFTLLQTYPLKNGAVLNHFDLYRLTDYTAALDFGFDELIADSESYSLIEWPTRAAELLPDNTLHIHLMREAVHCFSESEIRFVQGSIGKACELK